MARWGSEIASSVSRFSLSVIGLIVICATGCASNPAAPPAWHHIASPNPPGGGALNAVTCVSNTDCWAVGVAVPPSGTTVLATVVEHWQGVHWSVVPSPSPAAGWLTGVACASSASCWAVGYQVSVTANGALLEHWQGHSWSSVTTPDSSESPELNGISCPSPADCWAVGSNQNGALVEQLRGGHWQQARNPGPQGAELLAVACTSDAVCWAGGDTYGPGSSASSQSSSSPLLERWTAGAWKIVTSPPQSGGSQITAVACSSQSSCWAAGTNGNSGDGLIMEVWQGTSWQHASVPSPLDGNGEFNGLTCTATTCWVVGDDGDNGSASLVDREVGAA